MTMVNREIRNDTMKKIFKLIAAAGFAVVATTGAALAAGEVKPAKDVEFSFEGPFGTFDRGQLQRGYQVYAEVCAACHSMRLLAYRNLNNWYERHVRIGTNGDRCKQVWSELG